MSSKVLPTKVVSEHIATLRKGSSNSVSLLDLFVHYGVPLITATTLFQLKVELAEASSLIAGAAVLTGFSFGLSVFVFQLRMDAARDPRVPRESKLLDLLNELFANVLYSILAALALTVVAVISGSMDHGDGSIGLVWTAILCFLGFHYLLTLGMCIKRLQAAYREMTI